MALVVSDCLADRVVDYVRCLLGQHVSGEGKVNKVCAVDAGAHLCGV